MADAAMYRAKALRLPYCFFMKDMDELLPEG